MYDLFPIFIRRDFMNAEQQISSWGQVVTKAWQDDGFKKRFLANPSAVLKEHGLEVPPGVELRVVENTDRIQYLTLPAQPRDGELSDAELEGAAGGATISRVLRSLSEMRQEAPRKGVGCDPCNVESG